jgi:Neuraminidase (sialidase)
MTWTAPVDVTRQDDPAGQVFLDKQSITADPYHAGRAWVTWIQGNLPGENISFAKLSHAFSYRGTPMISRTTDGGQTWSAPQAMTNANIYAQGNQIAVLPDGTLLDSQAILYKGAGIQPNLNGTYMAVMRSTDAGAHWSSPTVVAPLGTVGETADGQPLRVGDYLPDLAVDPATAAVYLTWADGLGGTTNKIVISRSDDGGRHWTTPTVVSHHNSAQSFNHAVTVTNDGELAVLYYDDYRNDSKPGIPTDVYLRHSSDRGATWSAPQRLASFDLANAPIARGYFVGDYQGLAPIGARGLLAFFGVTGSTQGSANVLSIRLDR